MDNILAELDFAMAYLDDTYKKWNTWVAQATCKKSF